MRKPYRSQIRLMVYSSIGSADEVTVPEVSEDLLALDEALTKLASADPRAAQLVQLRYFAGLSIPEAAQPLGISPRSADLAKLNNLRHAEGGDPEITTRIASYELAYRMQTSVPELVDVSQEPDSTFALYGADARKPGTYAANCLLARRLAERGVRFVQLFHRGWDQHLNLPTAIAGQCRDTDQASAALIVDLKRRGLLDETLVVWGGRVRPVAGQRAARRRIHRGPRSQRQGDDGVAGEWRREGGGAIGATDEVGEKAVEVVHPLKDFHVTLLHLLGQDEARLMYFHEGRFKQLSQTGGERIKELLA